MLFIYTITDDKQIVEFFMQIFVNEKNAKEDNNNNNRKAKNAKNFLIKLKC